MIVTKDGRLGEVSWVKDSYASIVVKRGSYGRIPGMPDFCASASERDVTEKEWEPDITGILRSFGQNSHTLADFYAHSNWVDSPSKSGTMYPESLSGKAVFANGLGKTELWDEKTFEGIYTGTAEGCDTFDCAAQSIASFGLLGSERYYHNVEGGDNDVTTHAFWAKDSEKKEGFFLARDLATEHLVLEIQRLWDAAEGVGDLQSIYGMTKEQKDQRRVKFQTGEFCKLCPF